MKRLDQLSQVGLQHPQVAPGTPTIGGSFPRSFLIPGTETSLQVGGFVMIDAGYAMSGGSPNQSNGASQVTGAPSVSGLPLDLHGTGLFAAPTFNPHSRSPGVFHMSAGNSRFFVETRTPTVYGEALTHLEFDFYGCTSGGLDCSNLNNGTNPYIPRLRLAYGTLGGFMAGQNWIPGNDLESHAEIFDFGGEEGNFGYARAPQVGYKVPPVPWLGGATVGVYAVAPATQLVTPVGALEDDTQAVGAAAVPGVNGDVAGLAVNPLKSSLPDGAIVINWEQPWGHFQLHGVVRDEKLEDGRFITQEYIGYGGGFSGAVHPAWFGWIKDNLGFEAWAGDGLGHWGSDPGTGFPGTTMGLATNFGGTAVGCYGANATTTPTPGGLTNPPSLTPCGTSSAVANSAANAALVRATTITSWGGQVNYQHWWTPTLRSTLSGGVLHEDIPTNLIGLSASTFNFNKEGVTAHANLIWSPVPFINTGIEYVYGHRVTTFNAKGDENILDLAFQVKF